MNRRRPVTTHRWDGTPPLAPDPEVTLSWTRESARGALTCLAVILTVLLIYGFLIEPQLIEVEREDAVLPHLPREWEGRQIAVIADLQVGMWGANLGTVRRAVETIVRKRPAAVLLAGDFLYKAEGELPGQLELLTDLLLPLGRSGIPTFAVLGNHDWGLNWPQERKVPELASGVVETLKAHGIQVLQNEAIALRVGADSAARLYIVGIGSEWAGESRPVAALRQVPDGEARIVFMHNPDTFALLPGGSAPLAIAAHTHGGQVAIPFAPHWSWMSLASGEPIHADGWIRDYGAAGNRLYVNRGMGFSTLPVRINAMPEITWFTLRASAADPRAAGEPPRTREGRWRG